MTENATRLARLLRERGEPDMADELLGILADFAESLGDGATLATLAPVIEQAENVVGAATIVRARWFDLALDDFGAGRKP